MAERFFQALLKLLPAEFRGEYGREMTATFRAERRQARSIGSLARLWVATIADIFRTAPSEHIDVLARDLRYTGRMLVRRPILTLTATITLALGIGANTAIFSVVNGVLFATLPYPDADRLVLIQEDDADDEPGTTGYFSFDRLRSEHNTLDWMAALSGWSATFTGDDRDAERVVGARVTWEYFRTLGVTPALGRDFEMEDDHPQRRRQIILSDELWRRRFSGDPAVIGKPVTVNGVTYQVVGVMPASFNELVTAQLFPGSEVWTLLGYSLELPQACRSCRHIQMIGRVKRGVSVRQAEADLTRIYQSLSQQFAREYSRPAAALTPVRSFFLGPIQQPLLLLWGAVGLLLLMTCANMANLLLIRASEREEEIAIRKALGVSPVRLLRQLLTESVVLSAVGGAFGALLASWATAAIAANGPRTIPRLSEISVNTPVLLYALAISVITGVVFGMAPARTLVVRGFHGTRVTATSWRYRASLVAINVALSVLLLVGAGLLVRSFVRLLTVDPGFQPSGLLTFQIDLSGERYSNAAAVAAFYEQLSARLAGVSGVERVGAATQLPLTGSRDRWGITIEGRPLENPANAPEADRYGVTPGYFAAMNIPLLRGRLLTEADGIDAPPAIVIGKTMADELWPGEDPIGRRVTLAGGPGNPPRTIVGIVDDVRHYGLHVPATIQAYMPRVQGPWLETSMVMVVRARPGVDPLSLAAAAREQVRAIDALQPVRQMSTYDGIVAASLATRRFTLALLALFAATALLLAIVGLYGALSYVVGQRQREIGVRVALGAVRRDIRRLVLKQGMRPVAIGGVFGLLVAFAAARGIDALLFGVSGRDTTTYASAVLAIALASLVACLIPANRAARIDPAVTLRAE